MKLADLTADAVITIVAVFFLMGSTKPWIFPLGRRQIVAVSILETQQHKESQDAHHETKVS